jgi:long-chain fatty acid transport protein
MKRAALLLALALVSPEAARGQAFLRWDQAARALGMGGAAAALADDPSAAFFNPAGIVWLPGTQLQVGGGFGTRDASFDAFGAPDADADAEFVASPGLYVTHAIASGWTGGFSLTEPWRARVAWNDATDFVGRFRATDTSVRGLVFNPVIAWRPAPQWSVAAGVAVVEGSLRLERFEQNPRISALGGAGPIALAHATIDLESTGIGWNAGAYWRPLDELSAGIQFRSRVTTTLSGTADFSLVVSEEARQLRLPSGELVGAFLDRTYVDQTARSRLVLPAIVIGGVAWSPIPPVVLDADLQWTGWESLEEIALAFADTALGDATPLGYDDAWSLRLGAEMHPEGGLRLRVGFAREWSPAPFEAVTPLIPDADRSTVSFGAGTLWRGIDFDVGYRLTVLEDREGVAFPLNTSSADGIYESVEHAFAIAATRRF